MKYSKDIADEACKHISSGLSARDAAVLSGIGESTYYDWQREKESDGKQNPSYHVEFVEAIKKADILRKQRLIEAIRQDRSWQSKAWLLERLYKDEFSVVNLTSQRLDEIEQKLNMIEQKREANNNEYS